MRNNPSGKLALILVLLISLLAFIPVNRLKAAMRSTIDYIDSNKGDIGKEERQTSIYYHTNSLDQLWYGSDSWGVKYDFRTVTVVDSFTIETVSVYFPQMSGEINLKIYTDELQPLDSLAVSFSDIPIQEGWNEFDLNLADQVTSQILWVIVDYDTNHSNTNPESNRYMGASAVGGEHSYFWVPPEDPNGSIPGYYANMAEMSIVSELLITVGGILHFGEEGYDLELSSFEFTGDFVPGGNITPGATIKNNSATDIDDLIGISVRLTNADPEEDTWDVTIPYNLELPAGEEITILFDNEQYIYTLLETPAQYRLRAELQYDLDPYLVNNLIEFTAHTFVRPREKYLIENFVRSTDQSSLNIIDTQQDLVADSLYFINYFFNPLDEPYYAADAALRKDFYRLGGYPFTIIEGIESIAGYFPAYADTLSARLNNIIPAETFLYLDEETNQNIIDPTDYLMQLRFDIRNDNTHIFDNNLSNLRMFMALVEKDNPDIPGAHLIYLHRYMSDGSLTLGFEDQYQFVWTHNIQTINPVYWEIVEENLEHFEIIVWLQNRITREVCFVESFRLDEFEFATSVGEEIITPLTTEVSLYPNPLRSNQSLQFNITGRKDISRVQIRIYNIRGQLIEELNEDSSGAEKQIVWDGLKNRVEALSSGVYIARIEVSGEKGESELSYRKFLILP